MTTVRRWTGHETRALRQAMRMSIRAFASYLGVGVRTVAGWESSAGVSPRPEMQAALDTALARASDEVKARFALILDAGRPDPQPVRTGIAPPGVRSALLAPREWNRHTTDDLTAFLAGDGDLDDHAALRLAHEWRIVDPPQVVEVHAGRRVGERLARVIEERIEALRRMDDVLGGGEVHDLVHRELRVTLDLLRGASYSEKTGRRLLGAVADLCQLAGWVAGDAGLYPLAERYYLGGVSAAHAADDRRLAAHLLSSLAYQKANVGDPREAVLLARSAEQGAETTAGRTRALLYGRIAWASARCGDAPTVDRALAEVDRALDRAEPEADPSWLYWLDRDEAQIMAGRCMTELRRAAPAVELLQDAIGRYDDTRTRELALYLSWLAEAHVYSNNIDEAARVASLALQLSALVSSVRCHARLRTLRGLLSQYRQSATVREFEEEARQVLGP
ncbi:MAG TPA: hypothetical protein VF054_12670 [Micromonosporaceae bacterium]